jgi:transposase InsO family protein
LLQKKKIPKKSAGDLLKGHEMKHRFIEKNQMKQKGLVGRRKNRKVSITDSRHRYPTLPNMLNRAFRAETVNEK